MKRQQFYHSVSRSMDLLGNPLRLQIFLKILQEGCDCDINTQKGFSGNCVSGVMDDLKLPQSTVSSYIKDLEDGGLIECKKNGKFVYCRPNKEALVALKSLSNSSRSKNSTCLWGFFGNSIFSGDRVFTSCFIRYFKNARKAIKW